MLPLQFESNNTQEWESNYSSNSDPDVQYILTGIEGIVAEVDRNTYGGLERRPRVISVNATMPFNADINVTDGKQLITLTSRIHDLHQALDNTRFDRSSEGIGLGSSFRSGFPGTMSGTPVLNDWITPMNLIYYERSPEFEMHEELEGRHPQCKLHINLDELKITNTCNWSFPATNVCALPKEQILIILPYESESNNVFDLPPAEPLDPLLERNHSVIKQLNGMEQRIETFMYNNDALHSEDGITTFVQTIFKHVFLPAHMHHLNMKKSFHVPDELRHALFSLTCFAVPDRMRADLLHAMLVIFMYCSTIIDRPYKPENQDVWIPCPHRLSYLALRTMQSFNLNVINALKVHSHYCMKHDSDENHFTILNSIIKQTRVEIVTHFGRNLVKPELVTSPLGYMTINPAERDTDEKHICSTLRLHRCWTCEPDPSFNCRPAVYKQPLESPLFAPIFIEKEDDVEVVKVDVSQGGLDVYVSDSMKEDIHGLSRIVKLSNRVHEYRQSRSRLAKSPPKKRMLAPVSNPMKKRVKFSNEDSDDIVDLTKVHDSDTLSKERADEIWRQAGFKI